MEKETELYYDEELRTLIDSIFDMLADMTKEERQKFFQPKDLDFVKEIDGAYYVVRSHFCNEHKENVHDKVSRLISKTSL